MKIIAIIALFACTACGCTSAPKKESRVRYSSDGAVSAEIVDKPPGERYEPLPGETYFREVPKPENVHPTYPPELLEKQLEPVSVIVRLIVSDLGTVEKADIVVPAPSYPAFSQAVLTAVKTWTFVPLKRATGNKTESLPFTQDYKITFTQINGRAVVVQGVAAR